MKAHPLYARRVETERYQTLPDHLEHVADYAADFASGFPNTARAAGILHDIGKASRAFQDYLKDEKGIRGSVVHSLQGAFCVSEIPVHQASDVLAKELLELVIAAHHGGLADALDLSGDRSFFEKMAAQKPGNVLF